MITEIFFQMLEANGIPFKEKPWNGDAWVGTYDGKTLCMCGWVKWKQEDKRVSYYHFKLTSDGKVRKGFPRTRKNKETT